MTDLDKLSAAAAIPWEPRNGFYPAPLITKARWAYLMALESEHRTGNLVQIDREGMRERATLGIWHQLGQIEENVRAGQLTMEEVAVLADAAIAAILGGERE